MKTKTYEAPLCEVIEVELEGAILSGSGTLEGLGNGDDYVY